MKVLVIGMSPILGGVETYIFNLVKNMDKSKYSFDFLIIGQGRKSVFEDEINELMEDEKQHFYYAPNMKKNYMTGKKWLSKFYRENHYDVIYMNTCTAARVNYCLYAVKKGASLITHSHNGNGLSKINNFLFRGIVKKYSKRLLSCSDYASDWLYGNCHRDITIVSNGIDTERFSYNVNFRKKIRNELGLYENTILIGHVGRFYAQKNHKFFAELADKLPSNYMFLLIGDGSEKDLFIEKITDKKIDNKFIILEAQGNIEQYYSAMDIFAMPSVFEGLPIVAVEAQNSGLPCIFSNNISKQVDLSNRCIFAPLEEDIWVKNILSIDLQRYDGKTAVENKGYSINATAKMISNIIDDVV